jgi:hypothetical protein
MSGAATTEWCDFCGRVFPWHECKVVPMTPEEELEVLRELDSVTASNPATNVSPRSVTEESVGWFCGSVTWRTPNGWEVEVYNDCNEWDHVDRVKAPDGREWTYCYEDRARHAESEWVKAWTPIDEAGWPGAAEHLWPDPRPSEVGGRPYPAGSPC